MLDFIKGIRRFLGITNMRDDGIWFFAQYPVVQIFICEYLTIWFKQSFEDPSLNNLGFSKDMHITMAVRVTNYLLGNDKDKITGSKSEYYEEIKLANKHVEKWGDDVMKKDKDICELIIQTLRMYSIFKSYILDSNFKTGYKKFNKSSEGNRILNLLMKYGKLVPTEPNPKNYAFLLQKWYVWNELYEKNKKENKDIIE